MAAPKKSVRKKRKTRLEFFISIQNLPIDSESSMKLNLQNQSYKPTKLLTANTELMLQQVIEAAIVVTSNKKKNKGKQKFKYVDDAIGKGNSLASHGISIH